jgi:DNA polymerase III subunit gamma/tau
VSYLVLARKWRPQQLAEILGQEHVTRTLTNALVSGRIAHAFLFTGARGVGKTSAARILAKALCCERDGAPTATPCGECTACVEIAEGRATDVFEIDAASNTGVANVREIIDNVRYLPSKARFKIYIIDEVHMLSTGAFNALLKTLEEPPSHVKFILATTDVHKVPVTILSRCQRYDFRRIPLTRVAKRLSEILHAEGLAHEEAALYAVARESEGSMRDAQSLLEQVLTYAHGRALDGALVREALGVADQAVLRDTVEAILGRKPGRVLEIVREVHDRGLDLKRFADAVVEQVRDLLVALLVEDPRTVLDRPTDEIEELKARAKKTDAPTLERLFERLCAVVETMAESPYPRFALEVGLASAAEEPPRLPIADLLGKLDRLEATLASPAAAQGGAAAPRSFPEKVEPSPRAPEPRRAPEPPEPRPAPAQEPKPPQTGGRVVFGDFVTLVRKRRPTLGASLLQVRPLAFSESEVAIGCETSFDEAQLSSTDTKRFLEDLLAELFGKRVPLTVRRIAKGEVPATATLNEQEEAAQQERREDKIRDARERPAVKALEELGASVKRVRVIDES